MQLFLALVMLAAVQTAPDDASLDQPFELSVGGTATVVETGTQLTFRTVQEDSRCPAQVNCIWAGRVVVELEAEAPGADPETFVLSTCCTDADKHHVYLGQDIALTDVTPQAPAPGTVIGDQDYRALLVVVVSPDAYDGSTQE
jgi:hypothetical protein